MKTPVSPLCRFTASRFAGVVLVLAALCVALPAMAEDKKSLAQQNAETMSDLQVRVLKLEQLVEQLTGQLEEARFKNSQLSRQVQQMQDDLSLRVAGLEQAAGGAPAVPAPAAAAPAAPAPTSAPPREVEGPPRAVYDPAAPPSSPVAKQPESAPLPLRPTTQTPAQGQTPPQADSGFVIRTDAGGKALPPDPNAPPVARAPTQAPAAPPVIKTPPPPGAVGAAGVASSTAGASVTLPSGTPKQQYDFATDLLRRQDYARAEIALRAFLEKNPNDPLAGNAQYWLGESLYARGDYQQAAVEFMNGYKNYRKSAKGPDNLLKLGLSMENLRQTAAACTAFGSIAKEFPDADDKIRKDAQTERNKLKCPP